MAERHRDSHASRTSKDKEGPVTKGTKGAVEGTIGGCPVLIQTGPNIKVLAQVHFIMYLYMYLSLQLFVFTSVSLLYLYPLFFYFCVCSSIHQPVSVYINQMHKAQ